MKDINELKKELIDLALKIGDYYDINLDFSIESIKDVEKILLKTSEQYQKDKNNEGIQGIALELAAYIIAVIEKNITVGKWERDSDEFGKETFPYDLGGKNIIFPYAWCLKRIYDGKGENVGSKFEALVLSKKTIMKKETKQKIITYCLVAYGLIVMLGSMFNIPMGIGGSSWGKFAQAGGIFLVAIAFHRDPKKSWWFTLISCLYISFGWLLGFDKVIPESFSVAFFPSLILTVVPLIFLLSKDVRPKK